MPRVLKKISWSADHNAFFGVERKKADIDMLPLFHSSLNQGIKKNTQLLKISKK
jgi:hypothetical protein